MKKLFLIAFLLFAFVLQAQTNFKKGYFINNKGVRMQCYIKNVDWQNNPTAFEYKMTPEDTEIKTENMMGVDEFGIDSISRYKRLKIKMERSQTSLPNLSKNKAPVWSEETHFLKVLVAGDATLYVYTEQNLTKYFYQTKTTPVEQLVYIKYISTEDNRQGTSRFDESVTENNQFRQQLLNNVKCGNMTENDYKNLRYDKSSLAKIFSKYNSCTNSTMEDFVASDKRKSFNLKIVPGIYLAKLKIDDPSAYFNKSTDVTNVVFKIGIEAEYVLPFNNGAWSLFLSPAYQTFTSGKGFTSSDNLNHPTDVNYYLTADYSCIEIPFGVRHYFSVGKKSKIFVNAAYVYTVKTGESKIDFDSETINASQRLDVNSRNNLALGVGYAYKNFNMELRSNFGREILGGYVSWSAKYSSTGINFGYTFL